MGVWLRSPGSHGPEAPSASNGEAQGKPQALKTLGEVQVLEELTGILGEGRAVRQSLAVRQELVAPKIRVGHLRQVPVGQGDLPLQVVLTHIEEDEVLEIASRAQFVITKLGAALGQLLTPQE